MWVYSVKSMTSSNYANNNDIEEAVALELGLGVEVIERAQLSVEEERDQAKPGTA